MRQLPTLMVDQPVHRGRLWSTCMLEIGHILKIQSSKVKAARQRTKKAICRLDPPFKKDIATCETSQVITSFDYYNFHQEITFITR